MDYLEKITYIQERFEISKKRICYILDIPRGRMDKLLSGEIELSDIDKLKIDRAMKVQRMMAKHRSIEREFQLMHKIIGSLKDKLIQCLEPLEADNKADAMKLIEDIYIESQYLGLMYANNNEDETVLKQVKGRRK